MPLVAHYWADLQSVHELRCYGNVTGTRNVSEYMLVLALCLVIVAQFAAAAPPTMNSRSAASVLKDAHAIANAEAVGTELKTKLHLLAHQASAGRLM